MFSFSKNSQKHAKTQAAQETCVTPKTPVEHPLDALTGGLFSLETSAARLQAAQDWLDGHPDPEDVQLVYKELVAKDKGAARPLRDRLHALRQASQQDALAHEWQGKAEDLLQAARFNLADALAWQRDAGQAGAPLSREPLSSLAARLRQRIEHLEHLQNEVMTQNETGALLLQRMDLLSAGDWQQAVEKQERLQADLTNWQDKAGTLLLNAEWNSLEPRHGRQLQALQTQLPEVWEAFVAALQQAQQAALDPQAELPPVPVWARQLHEMRESEHAARIDQKAAKEKPAQEQRKAAIQTIESGVMLLEKAVAEGNTKNMHSATHSLRRALKIHGGLIDDKLEARVHAALVSAGELEGWQRWSANKLRHELIAQAEALLVVKKTASAETSAPPEGKTQDSGSKPQDEAQSPEPTLAGDSAPALDEEPVQAQAQAQAQTQDASASLAPEGSVDESVTKVPALGGRKLQETIHRLRQQWKTADRGGPGDQKLWKRFDDACNAAHVFVEQWLKQLRAQEAEHEKQRLELIEKLRVWTEDNHGGSGQDWKSVERSLRQFLNHWRQAGHVSEKTYARLQPLWKEAYAKAGQALKQAQKHSVLKRQELIEQSRLLAAQEPLQMEAIKQLQQTWQQEAQSISLGRRQDQKLWQAFRKPLDEAFEQRRALRKVQQRQQDVREQAVLKAAKKLQEVSQAGDAQKIQSALQHLQQVSRQDSAPAPMAATARLDDKPQEQSTSAAELTAAENATPDQAESVTENKQEAAATDTEQAAASHSAEASRPLLAVRGDDRPDVAAPTDKKPRRDRGSGTATRKTGRNRSDMDRRSPRPVRLSAQAQRAQRQAMETARASMRQLAAQAYGQAATQLLQAWQMQDVQQMPSVETLGKSVSASVRQAWADAMTLASQSAQTADQALLRLELAADVPPSADQLDAHRALKLQLLTQRHEPQPEQTWREDIACVLGGPYDANKARRMQKILRILLGKRS